MTANPAVAYPHPDVEAVAFALLKPLGGVTLWTYDVQESTYGWLTTHAIQVDVRASDKKRCHDRAWTARASLLDLAGSAVEGGYCVDVSVVSGPSWLPDENGAPRYVARYALTVRPGPTETPAPGS